MKEVVLIEEEFHISKFIIIYKLILGAIEIILGVGIILFGRQIATEYQKYKVRELIEDPRDLFITITSKITPYLSKHIRLVIFILIILGVIKIIGAIALLKKKHWGLDLLIGLTFILLPFQLVDLILHVSFGKFIFLLIDLFIALYLVQFEPRKYFKKMFVRIRAKRKK